MAIFQSSVLKKYLKQLDTDTLAKLYKKYTKYFHDSAIQQNIRESKEEQYQAKFLDELFVSILGYTLNPQPNFNLTTEFKNVKNSRKADGAILDKDEAIAVIELKGTKTKDLESIRQQAFDYKANQPGCVYVITSNFEKLRFYINNAVDFEEFDLFMLSYERFEMLYLCLHKNNLLQHLPLKIKEASLHEEEAITKKFYGDYSNFKRELFRDIVKRNLRNPELRDLGESSSKKELFKKTQKLLDRFLFIFFGEDRDLLPFNSIPKILEQWESLKNMDAYVPLYERYKKYFGYLNDGWKGQEDEIFAYNGGLFKPDPILDTIQIDDDLLFKHTSILTKYDFESQVDVNILGHIFEHSLNEIESVNAEIDGVEFDKQKTKRKKDGVFYTPKYITKYIVDKTVGKLCEEKKAELNIHEEEYLKGKKNRPKTTVQKLDEQLEAYRAWLLTLTICDPACGSGAFLNQALDFLILEHRWVDELSSKLHGGGFVFPDIENSILEKNIYGVDLNDESVEIAKLSLWLRTAQKGRKLTSLNSNIKCGNSLIDSKAVAGDKAFSWEKEFPEVFAKGGFDVIIGNPPYVVYIKSIVGENTINYVNKTYSFAEYNPNTYALFTDLALNRIVKNAGYVGFIIPNSWLDGQYFSRMRKGVYTKNVDEIVYLKDSVFAEVVETVVLLSRNTNGSKKQIKLSKDVLEAEYEIMDFDAPKFLSGYNPFLQNDNELLTKLETQYNSIGENAIVYRGLETRDNKKWLSETKLDDNFIPILLGRDVNRYHYEHSGTFVNFIKNEMKSNANEQMYLQPKILMRRTGSTIIATVEKEKLFALKNLYLIIPNKPDELYSMVAQLNSKLMHFFHVSKSSGENKAFAQFKGVYVGSFPYVNSSEKKFEELIEKIISLNNQLLMQSQKLNNYIQVQRPELDQTKKLQTWYTLDFSDFIKELNKAIKTAGGNKLSKLDELEWMELFETKKKEALELKAEIDKTDWEIDALVYELYGLTEEEIKIVEGA